MKYLFAVLILLTGCALLPDKDKTPQAAAKVGEPQARPQAGIEAKQLAAENEAELLAEVIFTKGNSRLSPAEAGRLKKVARRLKSKDAERVIVAAWADNQLPGADQDLADRRGKAVREYLEKNGGKDMDLEFHNMAQQPTDFAKFVGSQDARVKKSLEGARPSRAIVLVIGKD